MDGKTRISMNNENIYIATCRALFFLIKHIFVNKKLYFYDFYEVYLFGQENIYSFILSSNMFLKTNICMISMKCICMDEKKRIPAVPYPAHEMYFVKKITL